MKICGIICEYNPFHSGHKLHISAARRQTGADGILCVMSGNFVQRGDVAVYDKWYRASTAVRGGADLVVELPTPYALSSAQDFAEAGVHILESMGADCISFGSECGDISLLKETSKRLDSTAVRDKIKTLTNGGLAYHDAVSAAMDTPVLDGPNNLLGIEYIRASHGLSFHTVKRTNEHDFGEGCASNIRNKLLNGSAEPECEPHFMKYAEKALLSRLRAMRPEDIRPISGCGEGLENRLYRAICTAVSFEELIFEVKSKRYPLSRIRRLVLCSALGIQADFDKRPPYARVLAFNDRGREIISQAKSLGRIPVITKVSEISGAGGAVFDAECRATDFYTLSSQNTGVCGLEFLRSPEYKK